MKKNKQILLLILMAVLMAMSIVNCTTESSKLGRFYKGKVLHISVVEIERMAVISFSTIDAEGLQRNFQIKPEDDNNQIVGLRIKVENHTASTAIVNIDNSAAILNDFFSNDYIPVNIYKNMIAEPSVEGSVSVTPLWNNIRNDGSFESFALPKDTGIDGWMFFEVPINTTFKEFKWRAGDSLGIVF
jgi:hypothetical protein